MNLAIDTNAYRALSDGNHVLAAKVAASQIIGLPITVLGEIYYGIYYGSRSAQNSANLQKLLALPRVQILEITHETSRLYGEISAQSRRAGRVMQQNDVWIAALCKQYGFMLATADGDFQSVVGLEIFDF